MVIGIVANGDNGDRVRHWRQRMHRHWRQKMAPLAPMETMARITIRYDPFAVSPINKPQSINQNRILIYEIGQAVIVLIPTLSAKIETAKIY